MSQPPQRRPKVLVFWNHTESDKGAKNVSLSASETKIMADDDDVGTFFEDRVTQVVPVEENVAKVPPARQEIDALLDALQEQGYEAADVNLEDDIDRVAHAVVVARPNVLLNRVDSMEDDDLQRGHVAGLFELYGYAYTGSDPLCLTTCQERARTRLMLTNAGIPVPGFAIVRDVNSIPDTRELRRPVIATHPYDDLYETEGYRGGLWSREEVETRVAELAHEVDLPLLIEEFIDGRRIRAIVVGNAQQRVLPLVEEFFDQDENRDRIRLAQLEMNTVDRIRQLARRAFLAMDCRDVAQVDFCVDRTGEPYVVNVRPALLMGPTSVFGCAASESDDGYGGIVAELCEMTIERAQRLEHGQQDRGDQPPQENPAPARSTTEPS
jgi:D-alanine-D-alanine ligase